MRKLLQTLLNRPFVWMAQKFSGAPKKSAVFASLQQLYKDCLNENKSRGIVIDNNTDDAKYIIFSDIHKGDKSTGDDFLLSENVYCQALDYYYNHQFTYLQLGDAEELWKYSVNQVLKQNQKTFALENQFLKKKRFVKFFGNHDLAWKDSFAVKYYLGRIFSPKLKIIEGAILRLYRGKSSINIFLTHGHQGDKLSDNNAFGTWFVAHIWAPIQRYLNINYNTPSKDDDLLNKHNRIMYEWSAQQKGVLLLTGHTHFPVFASGKFSKNKYQFLINHHQQDASYFNTGCCCFSDGDITGIEIADGFIRLVKFTEKPHFNRIVLEEKELDYFFDERAS